MLLKEKKMLKINLHNHLVSYNTNTFGIVVDSVENAKEIEDVSLNSKDYLSVLMLPLFVGNDDEFIQYYAISDTHMEYSDPNVWKLPNIYLDTETLTNACNEDDATNTVIESITIWDTIEKLNELVGMDVKTIDGSTSGVITSCFFLDGNNVDKNARWIATYYDGEQLDDNVIDNITYDADDIVNIILM